jgi:hypothetical protein
LGSEVIANVKVEVAAFGIGMKQLMVGLQGDLEIVEDLAAVEPQFQQTLIR